MRGVILFFLALMMVGCGICGKIHYTPVESKTDSVYIEKLVWDTVKFKVPGDTVYAVSMDSSHLETRYSVSDAVVDSVGRLHHRLINKDFVVEKEIVTKEIEKRVEVEKEVPVEVEVPVKYIPGYYKWINGLFWGIIALFVIFIVVKVWFKIKV